MTLLVKQTEPEFQAILDIADGLEPELQAAFLKALEALKRQLPLNALTDMLEGDLFTDLGPTNDHDERDSGDGEEETDNG